MRRASSLLAWLVAAAAAAVPAGAAGPAGPAPAPIHLRPFSARYAFFWHGLHAGTMTFTLHQRAGNEWLYESATVPRGLFRLYSGATTHITSRMVVDAAGVRPIRFEGYEGSDTTPAAALDFDWQAMRVRGHMQEAAIDMELRPGVQDDLSIMVSLLHALEQGTVPAGIALFDKSGIRDYDYERAGEAQLATPLGQVATEVYTSHKKLSPRRNSYWLAPAYDGVPMRAEQRKDGDLEWRMEIESLERPAP